jgi:hypothetical protein
VVPHRHREGGVRAVDCVPQAYRLGSKQKLILQCETNWLRRSLESTPAWYFNKRACRGRQAGSVGLRPASNFQMCDVPLFWT